MQRLNTAGIVSGLAIAALASASAAAQAPVSSALGAPAQARTAPPAPAASVKPGEGAAIPSSSGAVGHSDNPKLQAAFDRAKAAGIGLDTIWDDRTINGPGPNGPQPLLVQGLGPMAQADPEMALYRVNQLINASEARTAWPTSAPIPAAQAAVNHIGGTLIMADGRVLSLERFTPMPLALPVVNGNGYTNIPIRYATSTSSSDDATMIVRVVQQGDNLGVYTAFAMKSGETLSPPPVTVPATGGTQTVALPGGGSFTVVLDKK